MGVSTCILLLIERSSILTNFKAQFYDGNELDKNRRKTFLKLSSLSLSARNEYFALAKPSSISIRSANCSDCPPTTTSSLQIWVR